MKRYEKASGDLLVTTPAESEQYRRIIGLCQRHERAPVNEPRLNRLLSLWAKAGAIRVEIYGKNWRVIEWLLTGDRTQEPPFKHNGPYKVMGESGVYEYTELVNENLEKRLRDKATRNRGRKRFEF